MASEALLAEALGAVLASKCDWVIVRPEGHGKFTVAGKGGGGLKALVPNLGVADVLFSLFRVQGKKCTRFIWLTWIGEEVSARKVSKRTKYTIKLPETDPPIVSTTCTSIEQLAANVESAVKVAETTTKQKKEKEKDQLLLSLKHRRHHSTAASTEQLQQLALRSPRGKASSLSVSASPIDDMQVSHARHRSVYYLLPPMQAQLISQRRNWPLNWRKRARRSACCARSCQPSRSRLRTYRHSNSRRTKWFRSFSRSASSGVP
eukprot:TRINITY_DN2998_c0_g1_i2.p1 TRINITY_DN2998_c0_g1~~TRINITY_DN2998_c0_g1_i2.p1  ORF type:complete len:271 (-),score=67.82 TRINITY_DN2998_c0_g1_i2:285-1070(-)